MEPRPFHRLKPIRPKMPSADRVLPNPASSLCCHPITHRTRSPNLRPEVVLQLILSSFCSIYTTSIPLLSCLCLSFRDFFQTHSPDLVPLKSSIRIPRALAT